LQPGAVVCHQPVELIEAKIVTGGNIAVSIRVVTRTIEQRGAAGRLADLRPQFLDDVGGGATQPGKTGMDKVIGSFGTRIKRRAWYDENLLALFLRQPGGDQRADLRAASTTMTSSDSPATKRLRRGTSHALSSTVKGSSDTAQPVAISSSTSGLFCGG
jgi:hypothetical protein